MILIESRSGRRFVGRLDRGANLFEALLGICRERKIRTAEIRALGSLETVEVAEYDQATKAWKPGRTFGGGMEILSLTANVSERGGQLALHAHASLMRDRDNGVEVLGGHVVGGRVFALEFVIEAFDDVILRRGSDAATGLTLWTEAISLDVEDTAPAAEERAPAPPPPPPPPPPPVAEKLRQAAEVPSSTAPSWADVARASARQPDPEAEPETSEAISLAPGDVVIHPTFGRCEVQRIEGGDEYAHVRLKNGRLVRLSLDILKLSRDGTENSRRVFKARIDD